MVGMSFLAGTIGISSSNVFGIQLIDFLLLLARLLRTCCEYFHPPALIVVFNCSGKYCLENCGWQHRETKPINLPLYYQQKVRKDFSTKHFPMGRIQPKLF